MTTFGSPHPRTAREPLLLLGLAFLSFVSLGLPDGLIGVAWPSIRETYGLGNDASGALFFTSTLGYVGASLLTGPLLARLGLGGLLTASCAATAVSLAGYGQAASWAELVAFGLLAGAGGGAIDAGLNTHAAASYSPKVLNLLHACYGVGTTIGPLLMTSVLMSHAPWQRGYLIVAAAQLVLTACFAATRSRWPAVQVTQGEATPLRHTLRLPRAWRSMGVFFCYVGVEAAAGVWTFAVLHEGRGVPATTAGTAVSVYWGGLLGGRLLAGLLPGRRPDDLGARCLWLAAAAMALLALDVGTTVSLIALAALGLASGPVFPLLIAATPARLGSRHAANAVGLQVGASALGLVTIPAASGWLAAAHLELVPATLLGLWLTLASVGAGFTRLPAGR